MTNPSNINGRAESGAPPKDQTESKKEVSPAAAGDARTPDKTTGQVKYADSPRKNEGGAGKPESSPLETKKQGGIGGS